jgi:putative transposase
MLEKPTAGFPLATQAWILSLNRTSLYYKPVPPGENAALIRKEIDKIYMAHPEFGYRRITDWLNIYRNISINHKAVYGHMRAMGIQAIYPRQDTSKPDKSHKIYPYLLKGVDINHPNHVWSIDITYIPLKKTWLYLVAIIDWFSRYIVAWRLDDNMEIGFVLDACREALEKGTPEIMNGDQGSQFTSPQYTSLFLEAGSQISMDHRGRAYDNIYIERLWRTVKYENVYLKDYESPREARIGIREYLDYYNRVRLHQSLKARTPEAVYLGNSRGGTP